MSGAGTGAAIFLPGAGANPFGRRRNRLRDLGRPEPEPHKKVAALQHCLREWVEEASFGGGPTLLEKFWRIYLHVTDDALAKQ